MQRISYEIKKDIEDEKKPVGNIVIEENSVNNMENFDIEETRDSEGIEEVSDSEGIKENGNSEGIDENSDREDIEEIVDREGTEEIGESEGIEDIGDSEGIEDIGDSEGIEEIGDSEGIEEIGDNEGIEEIGDTESIEEMISLLSFHKTRFDSLLQILEEFTKSYQSTFNVYNSIQWCRTSENLWTFSLISHSLDNISLNLRTLKSYISHIEDLFQLLKAIVKSTSENLKSLFPNQARQLVHTLEKAESGLFEPLNELSDVIFLCRMIVMESTP